jgi:hypothetical protein
MRFALRSLILRAGCAVTACLMLAVASVSGAFAADGAFVQQAGGSFRGNVALPIPASTTQNTGGGYGGYVPHSGSTGALPELAVPASGGNFAGTLEIGNYNKVFQGQFGAGNISNVGIIKGSRNNVGVLQAGNNLRSNIALVNTQGLNVGVIQPAGSAPINMLIARLPNGGLLIKR